ncbi:unnamed protein product [Rangifer tarandus platyrhynchus]|uniref:Uncharacterized protein n=1 Tax=Rangifer tarandus platyrhynchus TaxID=3082113 RepID=A0ABN8ZGC0_RANTA|nr:unnamed protein product [Rangifer tarandus platyrhynchus]
MGGDGTCPGSFWADGSVATPALGVTGSGLTDGVASPEEYRAWQGVSSRALELDRRLDDLQEGNLPSGEVRQSSDLMPSDHSVLQGKILCVTTKTCCHQINI